MNAEMIEEHQLVHPPWTQGLPLYPLVQLHKYPVPCEALTQWLLALTQAVAVGSSNPSNASFSVRGGQDPLMAQSSTRGTSVTSLFPVFLRKLLFRTRSSRWNLYLIKYSGFKLLALDRRKLYKLINTLFVLNYQCFLALLFSCIYVDGC